MKIRDDLPHYVYKHYDGAGRLLYVGSTCHPKSRPYARQKRPWIDESARVELFGPFSRPEALEIEAAVIHYEEPLHNKYRRTGSGAYSGGRHWSDRTPEEMLEIQRQAMQAMQDILEPDYDPATYWGRPWTKRSA